MLLWYPERSRKPRCESIDVRMPADGGVIRVCAWQRAARGGEGARRGLLPARRTEGKTDGRCGKRGGLYSIQRFSAI